MAVVSAAEYALQGGNAAVVNSMGNGPTEGWVTLARFPGPRLPNGDAHVGWVVFGEAGAIQGTSFGQQAVCEIALGRSDQPGTVFYDTVTRFGLQDGNLRDVFRMVPFFNVRTYQTGGTVAELWSNAVDLELRARIWLRGESPANIDASFRVANVCFLLFDLDELGSGNWMVRSFRPPATANNLLSEGWKQLDETAGGGVMIEGQSWLLFSSVEYFPVSFDGAPTFQTVVCETTPFVNPTPLVGDHSLALAPTNPQGARMGMIPRGPASTPGERCVYHHGGFRTFDAPSGTSTIGLRSIDQHFRANERSVFVGWQMLAVKSSLLGSFRRLHLGPSNVDPIYNENQKTPPLVYEPAEWDRTFAADVHVMAQASYDHQFPGSRSFALEVGTNDGLRVIGQQPWALHTWPGSEGVLNCFGFPMSALPASPVQFRFYGTQHLLEGGADVSRPALNFEAVSWHHENDPDGDPFEDPAEPPIIQIRPPREAPAVGSLNALPIDPDDVHTSQVEVPLHEFVSDAGYRTIWPRWLKPRRTFDLTWTGITQSQRDTLLDFFAAQQQRAFKWRVPHETVDRPFVLVAGPVAPQLDTGLLFALTVSVVELIHVGP